MSDEMHVIWSNYDSEDDEDNALSLEDERKNLDIQMSRQIIVFADLGLWDGRHSGYRIIESGNIKDCFQRDYDYNEWYVDTAGDLRGSASHHDGTNEYLYRAIREDATDEQVNRLYYGNFTPSNIEHATERLGDEIGKVYGWDFTQEQAGNEINMSM